MNCTDCECNPCICESQLTRREMLVTVLELMNEKVNAYQKLMQSRVYMIKEDIITTITEETLKFQMIINSNISKLDNLMSDIQEMEINGENEEFAEKLVVSPDITAAMNFNLDLNLDSESVQDGFNRALQGEFIVFREILKNTTKKD